MKIIFERILTNILRIYYYTALGSSGKACWFDRGIRMSHMKNISLGSDCMIFRNVTINAFGQKKFNIEMGKEVRIREGCYIDTHGGWIIFGDNVFLGPQCMIYGHGGLEIGRNTLIAGKTSIIPANHNFSKSDVPLRSQGESTIGIKIGDNVWIGTGSIILDGVHIGSHSVIGAGSVVTCSIPPFSVAVGSPAKVIRNRQEESDLDL